MNGTNTLSKGRVVSIALLLIAFGISAYLIFGPSLTKAGGYTLVPLTRGSLESTVSSTGTLSPVIQVEGGTQISGTMDNVLVDFNDRVKKGQVLAVIDTGLLTLNVTDAQSGYMKAEAQLEEAKANFDHGVELSQKGMLSASEFQTVTTTHKTAQASLVSARSAFKRAEQNLRYAIIRSPIDGTITARNVETGQTVAASFSTPTLFTMI
jgi:HlyD family secretion protein